MLEIQQLLGDSDLGKYDYVAYKLQSRLYQYLNSSDMQQFWSIHPIMSLVDT